MDEAGFATVLLPACDVAAHGKVDPYDFEHVVLRWEEMERLASRFPGRFAALAVVDPSPAWRASASCALGWPSRGWSARTSTPTPGTAVSAAEYYPYYALCSSSTSG